MDYSDTVNVTPFEDHNDMEEITRRGIELKYLNSEMELTITVKYRRLQGRDNLERHLVNRHIKVNNNVVLDDSYPFHATTAVFGSKIKAINLTTQQTLLLNGCSVTINEVCNEIDRLF
jgi:hypothetical protein